jgi:hypothetical protein
MNDTAAEAWLAPLGFYTDLRRPATIWGRVFTPLTYACATGHVAMLHYLFARNAATTRSELTAGEFEDGNTCWHYACMSGGAVQVLDWLQNHSAVVADGNAAEALVSAANDAGELPLHWAARYGYHGACEWLLARGTAGDASRDSVAGFFPLLEACCEGHLDCARSLLRNGAGPDLRRETRFGGLSPVTSAARDGHLHVILYLVSKGACFKELKRESYGDAGAVSEDENGDVDDTTDDDLYSGKEAGDVSGDVGCGAVEEEDPEGKVNDEDGGLEGQERRTDEEGQMQRQTLRRRIERRRSRRLLRRSRHIDEDAVQRISKLTRPALLQYSEKLQKEADVFRTLVLAGTLSARASPTLSKLRGHGDALKVRIASFLGVHKGRKRRIAREFREALSRVVDADQRRIEKAADRGPRELCPPKARALTREESSLEDVD